MSEQKYEYKTTVSLSLPTSYVDRIRNFQERYRINQKNKAFMQLIDLALFVESKLGLVQSISNDELSTLEEQFKTGELVDYVMEMDQRKFSLILNIMKDEEKARLKK